MFCIIYNSGNCSFACCQFSGVVVAVVVAAVVSVVAAVGIIVATAGVAAGVDVVAGVIAECCCCCCCCCCCSCCFDSSKCDGDIPSKHHPIVTFQFRKYTVNSRE